MNRTGQSRVMVLDISYDIIWPESEAPMGIRWLSGLGFAAMVSVASLNAADTPPKDTSLPDAVQRRDTQAVLSLLKKSVPVNTPQSDGATALHWAAYLNDAEMTALLIRAGAQVSTPNNYGVTPLVLAAENGNAAVLDQLLKA